MTKIIIDPAGGMFDHIVAARIRVWVRREIEVIPPGVGQIAYLAQNWEMTRTRVYRILAALEIERPQRQRQPQ